MQSRVFLYLSSYILYPPVPALSPTYLLQALALLSLMILSAFKALPLDSIVLSITLLCSHSAGLSGTVFQMEFLMRIF